LLRQATLTRSNALIAWLPLFPISIRRQKGAIE
jgi:hypothetical protein